MIEEAGLKKLRPGDFVNARSLDDSRYMDTSRWWPGWVVGPGLGQDTWKITFATSDDKRAGETWVVDLQKLGERKVETLGRERIMFVMRSHLYPKGSNVYHQEHGQGRVVHVTESSFMECDYFVVECRTGKISACAYELEKMAPLKPVSSCRVNNVEVDVVEEAGPKIPMLMQCPDEEIVV